MNNEWRLSRYNIFAKIPDEDKIGCVNLFRGTWDILSFEELYNLQKLQLKSRYLNKGFVVNYDEREVFKFLAKNNILNKRNLNFTICPTLNCNFNCPYCFEEHRSGKMSEETQEEVVKFIKNIVNYSGVKSLSITWFGGEPLLEPDIIISLSKKIIEFCEGKKINYNANIVTNGYLITQEIADIFFDIKIRGYQITLDGIGEMHNKTRCLIGGQPTYDKILNNLKNIKIKSSISIRCNLYEDNYLQFNEIKKEINKVAKINGNFIRCYPAFVTKNTVADKRNKDFKYIDNKNFNKTQIKYDITKNNKCTNGLFCGAQTLTFFVIDELGNLYKCWEDVDKINRSYGNVKTWNFNNPVFSSTHPEIFTSYMNTGGVSQDEECQDCIWLPVCRGSCPNKILTVKKNCLIYKDDVEDYVLEYIKYYKEKQDIKNNKLCQKNKNI